MAQDQTMIRLSEDGHRCLGVLKEDGVFEQMADGFRFALALALEKGLRSADERSNRQTVFSVATIDPNRELYELVQILCGVSGDATYSTMECLADWGLMEIKRQRELGEFDVVSLLAEAMRVGCQEGGE